MTNASNDELVTRAQDGAAEAISCLFENNYQKIYRFLYYRVGDTHIAEDLTSEVFLKMIQALPGYRIRNVPFQAWLFQIARNLAIDHHRKQALHMNTELHENIKEPAQPMDEIIEKRLSSELLHSTLKKLTDDQRDVIILRFIEGMSLTQVAGILHKSEDAIKGLQHRALISLRGLLYNPEVKHVKIG